MQARRGPSGFVAEIGDETWFLALLFSLIEWLNNSEPPQRWSYVAGMPDRAYRSCYLQRNLV